MQTGYSCRLNLHWAEYLVHTRIGRSNIGTKWLFSYGESRAPTCQLVAQQGGEHLFKNSPMMLPTSRVGKFYVESLPVRLFLRALDVGYDRADYRDNDVRLKLLNHFG